MILLNVMTMSLVVTKNEIRQFKDAPTFRANFLAERLDEIEQSLIRNYNSVLEEKITTIEGERKIMMRSQTDHGVFDDMVVLRVVIGMELSGIEEAVMLRLSSDCKSMNVKPEGFRHAYSYDFGELLD